MLGILEPKEGVLAEDAVALRVAATSRLEVPVMIIDVPNKLPLQNRALQCTTSCTAIRTYCPAQHAKDMIVVLVFRSPRTSHYHFEGSLQRLSGRSRNRRTCVK